MPDQILTQPQNNQPSFWKEYLPDIKNWLLGAGGAALGAKGLSHAIISPAVAARIPRNSNKLFTSDFVNFSNPNNYIYEALKNSKAKISPEGIELNLRRYQVPEQANENALSGGVFYIPASEARHSPYRTGRLSRYGGPQTIKGTTLLRNPLFSYGDEGWLSGAAHDLLGGEGRYNMEKEAYNIGDTEYNKGYDEALKEAEKFRQKWSPETANIPPSLFDSDKGSYSNWLQQAAIAHAARKAGYDSIIPLSLEKPRIDEIFDLRENKYPGPEGQYSVWPQYQQYVK